MKLAEALALRADIVKRIGQLQSRASQAARYQEGDEPEEKAADLLEEILKLISELEALIRRINRTNSAVEVEPGITLTDAIAIRDALGAKREAITKIADAATGGRLGRYMRSEIRDITNLPVAELRRRADDTAQRRRHLDVRIQQVNWSADLLP